MINQKYNMFKGIVVSSNDPDQKGKIQVRILPHCSLFKEADCPWILPFTGAFNSSNETEYEGLEKGSLVWVIMDEHEYEKFYVGKYNSESFFDFSAIENVLNGIDEIESVTYESITFKKYADGSIEFHNKSNGEMGVVVSGGQYSVWDSSGNLYDKVNKYKLYNEITDLKSILKAFQEVMVNTANGSNYIPTGTITCVVGGVTGSGVFTGINNIYTPQVADQVKLTEALTNLNALLED